MTAEPYIHTAAGRRIYVRHPDLNVRLHLEDFAHSLARISRYNGHAAHRYSVASHSLMAADLVPREFRAGALLHDAVEAVLGDVTSPLKSLLPEYRTLQDAWTFGMEERWGVKMHGPEIKVADRLAYTIERRDLMPRSIWDEPWPNREYLVEIPPGAPRCTAYADNPVYVAERWYAEVCGCGVMEIV